VDVAAWLNGLGFDRYKQAFEDNAIDFALLPRLTADDLRDIGITAVGHRRKLLEAIAALQGSSGASTQKSDGPTVSPVPRRDAERRQLTVMFVDLVGSTELSLKLDPEELREVSRAYQDATAREVGRFGGHVAKYMGDGVLVYFGYPQAHEDDAVRAIYAGLAVVRAVKHLGKRMLASHGGRLRARIGVATGVVVVGDLVGTEGSEAGAVTGETPNLAYRLQEAAGQGQVVVAERTRVLAGEAFKYEEPEQRKLKGFPDPMKLWRVLGPSGAESRFEALHGRWLTPMVGREHEIALLMERWRQAKEGEGQVVLVSSEAGIGKSRITEVLRERVMADQHLRIRLQCSPYHTNSALYPIIEHLERAARFERDDTPEAKLDKLEAMIGQAATAVAATAALLAPLLSIPTRDRYPPLGITPERQKERTLAALTDQVIGLAASKPVLMIVEDAHWIDPTTLESIDLTIARVETSRVLLLITFRPEFQPKWLGRPHVTSVLLNRLSKRQVAEMVDGVTGGRALPPAVLDQIIARTDGVPLFVEELTRMVVESGLLKEEGGGFVLEGPLPPMAIPSTLQDSLMARLDRLAPARNVAQTAAAIGRTFSHKLLSAVVGMEPANLDVALDQLVDSGLVFRQGAGAEARFTFKHALVQDAAYQSMLKSQRQRLHARIGNELEAKLGTVAEAAPEMVAQHYAEAEMNEAAIHWWHRAGEQAVERSANVEAIAILNKAVSALDLVPDRARLRDQEFAILTMLGSALGATKGYGAPETKNAYMMARDISMEMGDVERSLPALFGVWASFHATGQHKESWKLLYEFMRIAEDRNSEDFKSASRYMLIQELFLEGKFKEATDVFEERSKYGTGINDDKLALEIGEHPGALTCGVASWSYCFLGDVQQSIEAMNKGMTLARFPNHANSIATNMFYECVLYKELGDSEKSHSSAADCMAYAEQQEIPAWIAVARVLKGLAECYLGDGNDSVASIRQGLADWQKRYSLFVPQMNLYLAEACLVAGRFREGLEAVEEGSERAVQFEERAACAELHRIRGELLAASGRGPADEVETCFRGALDVAREQQAKTFELRAATSLARLWSDRGERQRAHDLLAPIFGWFTEGFGTRDLEVARTLLDSLK
jgi:class 3 adenylate cyclase/tetratricopeptide (TPR) repeat protein